VEYEVDSDSVRRAIERVLDGEVMAALMPYDAAIWGILKEGVLCSTTIRLVRGVNSGISMILSPCSRSSEVVVRARALILRLMTAARGYHAQQLKGCSVTPRIGIHQISGGWIILAMSIAVPFALVVGRYLWYLSVKCVQQYGSLFVLPFSSSEDDSSQQSNGIASEHGEQFTADELRGLEQCARASVVQAHRLERASSPPIGHT